MVTGGASSAGVPRGLGVSWFQDSLGARGAGVLGLLGVPMGLGSQGCWGCPWGWGPGSAGGAHGAGVPGLLGVPMGLGSCSCWGCPWGSWGWGAANPEVLGVPVGTLWSQGCAWGPWVPWSQGCSGAWRGVLWGCGTAPSPCRPPIPSRSPARRPRGGCLAVRHGGHGRLGHQRGAVRHHAVQRAQPARGAAGRAPAPHRRPRAPAQVGTGGSGWAGPGAGTLRAPAHRPRAGSEQPATT